VAEHSGDQDLEFARLTGPAREFALFCAMEMERREISSHEFDAGLYKEAVKLVLHLLQSSEEGEVT
jgi:hypothetical protein